MRKVLAVLLAGLFLILFLVAVTLNQVVDTATDPGVITGMINDAEAYDYVYDDIIGNLVTDLVEQGVEVNTGLDETSAPTVLRFEDTEAAALAIRSLIETLVPREYVKEKFEESLNGVVPYAKGDTDEFTIDLEVQERVRAVPTAVRQVVSDLMLTDRVIDDVLVPQLDVFSEQISGDALGIEFTPQEIEDNACLIFAPEWLEGQLFGAIDEVVPYFAGDTDSFNVVLQFDDRVVIVGQILKDKLNSQGTLYNLVFAQVIDPLIEQTVAQSTTVGFGVALTEDEVVDTFEAIAPQDWVQQQGDGVVDALIDYLVGNTDELSYTVDLSDRKIAAADSLKSLARQKLESTLGAIPDCTTPAQVIDAQADVQRGQLPRCVAGGQVMIDLALTTFGPTLDAQVESFVDSQVPADVSYSLSDFQSQVGGGLDTLDDVRRRIREGVSFSEQDLIDALAADESREARADAEETLQILAAGVVVTEANITDNLTPAGLDQLDQIRDYVNLGLSLRWLLWVLVLIPLVIIAFIGGGGWSGRLKWAGGVALVSAVVVYAGIAVGWSFIDVATNQLPDFSNVNPEFKADYPRMAAELESGEPVTRFERAMDSWQRGWRNQTVPWIIAGILAIAAGVGWPRLQEQRTARAGAGAGSSAAGSSSAVGASTTAREAESDSADSASGEDDGPVSDDDDPGDSSDADESGDDDSKPGEVPSR